MSFENTSNGSFRLEISSDFRWLDVLNASLTAVAEELEWDVDFTNAVSISAIEAASNAIEHGNGLDSSKKVWMKVNFEDGKFMMGIRDEGPGVDASVLDRPAPRPDDLSLRGRGFSIMNALMDDIRFLRDDEGQFTLELEKLLPESGEAE
jgi:anti-sigma regulatory factor (Ser/Thr protein kinase)